MGIFAAGAWTALTAVALGRLAAEGFARRRRAALLAARAHQDRLRFLLHGPSAVLARYRCLDVVSAGHDIRLRNMAAGRVGDVRVRTFDLCFQQGHGLGRRSHRASVVVAESSRRLPSLKMWTTGDLLAALGEAEAPARVGRWFCCGRAELAAAVDEVLAAEKSPATMVATSQHALMLCATAPESGQSLAPGQAVRIIEALADGRRERISVRNVVETEAAS